MYQQALGFSDPVSQTPLKPGMPFNLASVAKQFVTMGIMILKEERRLDYDDDVRFPPARVPLCRHHHPAFDDAHLRADGVFRTLGKARSTGPHLQQPRPA
ncbi:MAG: serine hydrolase [Haliscomenobacter sp.]|nr:serine hydrolase [Haliscomenobacter sp.]